MAGKNMVNGDDQTGFAGARSKATRAGQISNRVADDFKLISPFAEIG
jgi:hypothetical protein